jgi:hypothetical protein
MRKHMVAWSRRHRPRGTEGARSEGLDLGDCAQDFAPVFDIRPEPYVAVTGGLSRLVRSVVSMSSTIRLPTDETKEVATA